MVTSSLTPLRARIIPQDSKGIRATTLRRQCSRENSDPSFAAFYQHARRGIEVDVGFAPCPILYDHRGASGAVQPVSTSEIKAG